MKWNKWNNRRKRNKRNDRRKWYKWNRRKRNKAERQAEAGTSGTTGGSGQGGTSGSGGGGGQDSELPDVPDSPFGNGDGEPDWGGLLKSNGDFGSFRPSSAFSTGGACPQDITLDFSQFGTHQLPMSYVCMAVEKTTICIYFYGLFFFSDDGFKTVNSMKRITNACFSRWSF